MATKEFIEFLKKEFDVFQRGDELTLNCPFCGDDSGRHFSFNTLKDVGHCWKNPDHSYNEIGFMMAYNEVGYYEAVNLLGGFDRIPDIKKLSVRIKKIEKELENEKKIDFKNRKFDARMPSGSVRLFSDKVPKEVKNWFLRRTSSMSDDLRMKVFKPYFCINNSSKHKYRVIFRLLCNGNKSYLSYNTLKYGKKTFNPVGNINSSVLGFYNYSKRFNTVIVCEGLFDSSRIISYGYGSVCIFGKNISNVQLDLLDSMNADEVVICLDGDAINDCISLSKKINMYLDSKLSYMKIEDKEKDPDDLSKEEFKNIFNKRQSLCII